MTAWFPSLRPRTIFAQITCGIIVAVVLTNFLGEIVERYFINPLEQRSTDEAASARVETVVGLLRSTSSADNQRVILAAAKSYGLAFEEVPTNALPGDGAGGEPKGLVVPLLSAGSVVLFTKEAADGGNFNALHSWTATIYSSIGVTILIISGMIYVLRAITLPLSRFVRVARAFGRSGEGEQALPEDGSHEIRELARALNDMRDRIRALVEARTRMLRAISHDLRTPLTRLRLRIERSPEHAFKEGMLRDVDHIDRMIDETLSYLRDKAQDEAEAFVDLPSLLQTVCADFADIGHDVTYEGPRRFRIACRPGAMARAIGNLVENGVKFGHSVTVALHVPDGGVVRVEVSDDGPGIAPEERTNVLEPFSRGDEARTSRPRAGFGLGLAIVREIVSAHDGRLDLLANQPRGLTARITLTPAVP